MTRPMPRIAYLTGEYPRASDTFIQREVAALRELGHEVLTCSIRRTGAEHHVGPEQRAEAAATFNVLKAARNPARLVSAHIRYLKRPGTYFRALVLAWRTAPKGLKGRLYQLFYFAEAAVLADHLQRNDVTHLHNHIAKASCTVAMLVNALSGVPYSFTIHGPDIFFEPMHWRIDEKVARAQFVACISHFCRSQVMCFAAPEHWSRLHIVHCGVDPDRYSDDGVGRETGTRLLFVGRLAGVKGVPVLLQALARLKTQHPALQLTLIGDGPERPRIEAEAKALGLGDNTRFLGYQSQDAVAEALQQSDLFVLPSFAEGLPVVLMEAMAAALPVVTTRIAGVPELVQDGESGLLVAPGDVDALSTALETLVSDPKRRARMGRAGREKVCAEFDIMTEARKLSALFRQPAGNAP